MERAMENLYEYGDRLNSPISAFNYAASPDNFPILPHWHYFFEIIRMAEGTAEAVCGGYAYTLRPGDVILFFPQSVHSVHELKNHASSLGTPRPAPDGKNLPDAGLRPKINAAHNSIYPIPADNASAKIYGISYQVIKFDLNFLNMAAGRRNQFFKIFEIICEKSPEYIFFSSEMLSGFPIRDIFDTCINELEKKYYGYDVIACSQISALLSYFTRNWIGRGLNMDDVVRASNDPSDAFPGIIDYIEKHYNESLKIQDLAKMCKMSYSSFARLFKKTYHQSCKEYIEFIRLNKVKDLLRMTNIDLTCISNETGFSDCSHLIRTFKKWTGMTPKQWRKSISRHAAQFGAN